MGPPKQRLHCGHIHAYIAYITSPYLIKLFPKINFPELDEGLRAGDSNLLTIMSWSM